VTVARVSKDRLLQARWPETGMPPANITRNATPNGRVLSQNEA
jgi:hypothetical protein